MTKMEQQSLLKKCLDGCYPMLWRMTGAYAPASLREDLFQEMLLQIWLALPRFRADSKLSTWAYRVALNTSLNWSRKHKRQAFSESHLNEELVAKRASSKDRDRVEQALHLMQGMAESDRTILLLALEEWSTKEMAEILGLSQNAISVRLHRARKKLMEQMKKEMES